MKQVQLQLSTGSLTVEPGVPEVLWLPQRDDSDQQSANILSSPATTSWLQLKTLSELPQNLQLTDQSRSRTIDWSDWTGAASSGGQPRDFIPPRSSKWAESHFRLSLFWLLQNNVDRTVQQVRPSACPLRHAAENETSGCTEAAHVCVLHSFVLLCCISTTCAAVMLIPLCNEWCSCLQDTSAFRKCSCCSSATHGYPKHRFL